MYLTHYFISKKLGPKNIIQNMKEKGKTTGIKMFVLVIFITSKNMGKAIQE